jgi:hypothetical protein
VASLNDYHLPVIQAFVQKIANRRMFDGTVPGSMTVFLSIDEARMVWAATAWLDFYIDWDVWVQKTDFDLQQCKQILDRKMDEVKALKTLTLTKTEIMAMADVAMHLDNLAIKRELDAKPTKRRGKRN